MPNGEFGLVASARRFANRALAGLPRALHRTSVRRPLVVLGVLALAGIVAGSVALAAGHALVRGLVELLIGVPVRLAVWAMWLPRRFLP